MNEHNNNNDLDETREKEHEEEITGVEELDNQELRQFLSKKKKEEELSSYAYKLMEEASKFAEGNEFDEAITKYQLAEEIFKELGWDYEIERVQKTIKELKLHKEEFLAQLAKQREEQELQIELEKKQREILEKGAKQKKQAKEQQKAAKIRELETQKREMESFQQEISNLTDRAEKLARNYEILRKKKLRDGEFPEENPYPEIIDIYETVYKKLLNKGWKRQAEIYSDQIKIYKQKLEKDKKLRDIEIKKVEKQKQIEDLHKIREQPEKEKDKGSKMVEVKEDKKEFEEEITNLVNKAERLAREYEIIRKKKLKDGKFPEENPYPEIIDIYEAVYKKLLNKSWNNQAEIYKKQIEIYKEKQEKDKKLREIEAQKIQKQKQIEELHRISRKSTPQKEITEPIKKDREEAKSFEEQILELVDKAELLAREYEIELKKNIKQGKFPQENPYPEIIEIYEKVYKKLLNKGWKTQAEIYKNQIKIYQEKLKKEKKLREIEAEKVEKQKQIEEMHKISPEKIKEEQIQEIEGELKSELEDKRLENYIDTKVDQAEKMAREYEVDLMKGNFAQECPYREIIEIYRNLRDKLQEHGWYEESALYAKQIQFYKDKLEKDKKLRRIESRKGDQELIKEIKKVKKPVGTKSTDEKILEEINKKEEEEDFQAEISKMVDKAEKIAREYENELKKGNFEIENKYPDVIKRYRKIRKQLIDRGWLKEAELYLSQINLYKEKAQRVEKLKKIEAQKAEREKRIEEMYKLQKPIEKPTQTIDEAEVEEKKEKEEKLNQAMSLIDEAEQLVRIYKSKLKPRLADYESPYLNAIDLYEMAKDLLIEIGWENEAARLNETIAFYMEKKQKDDELRALQKQNAEIEVPIDQRQIDIEGETQKAYVEVQTQRQREKEIYDQIFDIITQAENFAKEYNKKIEKGNILDYEPPYEEVIDLYKDAKQKFQQVGWEREAEKLNESISYYSKKLEEDKLLKKRERERRKRKEQELFEQQKLIEESQKEEEQLLKEQQDVILREKQAQKKFEQQKEEAFKIIDNALDIARNYNRDIQEGNILEIECPYEKVIDLYQKAKNIFQEIGWVNEADKMDQSINYYKQKLEEDIKLRKEEKQRIARLKQERLEQQRLIEEARKEEQEILELQEETIEKERREKEIFERKKDQAFELMDKAKNALEESNFEESIRLYKETREIFKNINWNAGLDLVEESINSIFKQKREYEKEQQLLMKEKEKQKQLQEQIEKKIEEMDRIKKLEEEEKRKEILRIQEEKRNEKEITDRAFKLLEDGTDLVEKEEFDRAQEKYLEARDLFTQVGWEREVSRINSELLVNLEKERERVEKRKEAQKRRRLEEEELQELLMEEEQKRKEQKRREIEEKRKRLAEMRRASKPKEEVMDKLELAKIYIMNYKYNEAFISLKEKLKEVDKEEIQEEIKNIIENIKEQANLPLIVSMAPNLIDNERFIISYEAIDRAERSIKNRNYMKAISELNEARFNLENVNADKRIMSAIDEKIIFYKQEMGHEIAETTKHEEALEDLKSEIARRRKERKKRLRGLERK
ncbi:MAG: hypothetical protein GF311_08550 [Candidatus Lokiarchaeota archaeon]|nr:hypothetical protein [Candidatus Lokiarchaeota archaeon]